MTSTEVAYPPEEEFEPEQENRTGSTAPEPEEALRLIPEALALVDEKRDPGLVYAAVHNQFLFIVDCGRFSEGRTFLLRHSRILNRDEGCMTRTRLRWIEGRLEAGLDRYTQAYIAAERGYVDAVIQPHETRRRLINALEMLDGKRDKNPPKKHGNIPL